MKVKHLFLVLLACLISTYGLSQKFMEDDAKQFYRTMQGDYVLQVNDSTTAMAHFTPIWENSGNRFQWMYVEAEIEKDVVFQKIIELKPITDKKFRVYLYDLKNPERFAGKWGNRSYFDGFTTAILKGRKRVTFVKTSDFSYQTSGGLSRYGAIDCFPKGDLLHIKFVQADERFYIKRVPKRTNRIIIYQGLKELTDGPIG